MDDHPTHASSYDPKTPLLPIRRPIQNQHFSFKSLLPTNYLFILLGPLACTFICLFADLHDHGSSRNMLAVLSWVFIWWLTEAVPMPITSMSPLFLFPIFGIASSLSFLVQVMMATLLFIIPNRKQEGEKLMDWNKCKKIPWNVILLLGAGFAIADGVRSSGLADILSASLGFLKTAPELAITPLVCLVSSSITEFTSNNATTTLVIPLLIQLAKTMSIHPLLLMVPGTIGAQLAFLLPTGTPSNIVGFTTGHIEIKDMITIGLPLKVAAIGALSLLMPTLGAFVFRTK